MKTYTVGDKELLPVDRIAARVVSPGPAWCAPDERPLPDAPYARISRLPLGRMFKLLETETDPVARLGLYYRGMNQAQRQVFDSIAFNPDPHTEIFEKCYVAARIVGTGNRKKERVFATNEDERKSLEARRKAALVRERQIRSARSAMERE